MAKERESIVAGLTIHSGNLTDSESDTDSTVGDYSSPITESSSQAEELLDKDPFGSEKSKRLFEAIDELRGCGAGQDLDLPQVRDQNCFHRLKLGPPPLTDTL